MEEGKWNLRVTRKTCLGEYLKKPKAWLLE